MKKNLKKITIILINFIYLIDISFDINDKDLKNAIEILGFPEMIEMINPSFIEMIRKRGELIIVNCGHNGYINRLEKDNLDKFFDKYLLK